MKLPWLLIVLTVTLLGAGDDSSPPQCAGCDSQAMTRVSPLGLFHFIKPGYSLPDLRTLPLMDLPDTPITFRITVNQSGVPCEIKLVHDTDARLSQPLTIAIRGWRFRPAYIGNRPLCLTSLVYFYVRRQDNKHTTVVIPYLTDREEGKN
jgi:hypothetical protein